MTYKEDRGVVEKPFQGPFETNCFFQSAKSIQNKMPPRQDSRSGLHKRFEPVSTEEVNAHPLVMFNFHEVGCLEFFQRVQDVKSYLPLTRLCALRLQGKQFQLAGLDFKFSPRSIYRATKIPYVGEKWFKQSYLDPEQYEPFLKPEHRDACPSIFPLSYLLTSYAPLMKIIMKYFTCEGRFSRVYAYHVQLLMHFTRAQLLNLPFFLHRSIENMASTIQKRPPSSTSLSFPSFPYQDYHSSST